MEKERSLPSKQMWQAMIHGIEKEIVKYDTIGNLVESVRLHVENLENENSPLNQQLKLFKELNPHVIILEFNKK